VRTYKQGLLFDNGRLLEPIKLRNNVYLQAKIGQRFYGYHRLVWMHFNGKIPKGMVVDHIDRNPRNNKIENLRLATYAQNSANRRKSNKGKNFEQKGVGWNGVKYISTITHEGKRLHLGSFETEWEAAAAYIAASKELNEEFSIYHDHSRICEKEAGV